MIIIVMGVSGCGKSTVAAALAQAIGGKFLDADDYHPSENIAKMSQGIPLTDADRAGWLDTLAGLLRAGLVEAHPLVLACSALKESYRQILRVSPEVCFVYLRGSFELISARIKARTGHFMKPGLLESQFLALEEPTNAFTVDVSRDIAQIVADIIAEFEISPKKP